MARKRSDGEGVYLLPIYMPNGLWCMDYPAMRKEINARDVYYCRLTGEVFNVYAAPVLAPDTCPMRPLIYTEDDE